MGAAPKTKQPQTALAKPPETRLVTHVIREFALPERSVTLHDPEVSEADRERFARDAELEYLRQVERVFLDLISAAHALRAAARPVQIAGSLPGPSGSSWGMRPGQPRVELFWTERVPVDVSVGR